MARRQVDEAARDAERRIVALTQEIAALEAREAQDRIVLQGMEANLELFTEQYRAGRRSLLELVGQFESLARAGASWRRSSTRSRWRGWISRASAAFWWMGRHCDGGPGDCL